MNKKETSSSEWETIELDLTQDEFCVLAKGAHELDITLNEYINLQLSKDLDLMEKEYVKTKKVKNTTTQPGRKNIPRQEKVQKTTRQKSKGKSCHQ
jgi:hypothetical protein